jgi:hypothetical protein
LNLALLIDAQDQGFRRRVHIQPDDVPQLAHKVRIAAELEGFDAMGLQDCALAPERIDPEDLADELDDLLDTDPPEAIMAIIVGVLKHLQEQGVELAKRD